MARILAEQAKAPLVVLPRNLAGLQTPQELLLSRAATTAGLPERVQPQEDQPAGNGNPEQEANLECIVRKGFGIRLRKRRLAPELVTEAIERLLADKDASAKAKAFRRSCEAWDGPQNAARFLVETFAGDA